MLSSKKKLRGTFSSFEFYLDIRSKFLGNSSKRNLVVEKNVMLSSKNMSPRQSFEKLLGRKKWGTFWINDFRNDVFVEIWFFECWNCLVKVSKSLGNQFRISAFNSLISFPSLKKRVKSIQFKKIVLKIWIPGAYSSSYQFLVRQERVL
jgi:hypothetical protein